MLLESYTTLKGDALRENMPSFLNLGPDVTGDSAFSMFNLSLKEEWVNSSRFCHKLSEEESDLLDAKCPIRQEAQERLDANRLVSEVYPIRPCLGWSTPFFYNFMDIFHKIKPIGLEAFF